MTTYSTRRTSCRTSRRTPYPTHRLALFTIAIALSPVIGLPLTALADNSVPSSVAQNETRVYQIPTGSLESVLNQFALAAGIELSIASPLVAGKTSEGLHGEYTLADAFSALLAGSNLTYRSTGTDSFTLEPAKQVGVLSKVKVTAEAIANTVTEGTGSYSIASMNTASKLDLSIRETPQSVSVVTRELLNDSNANTLTDALRMVPGVVIESSGPGYSSSVVRGFGLNNLQIDGVAYNTLANSDDYLFDTANTASVDRIEVVRGATGIVNGSGQPSGTVNIIRKLPTQEFQGRVSASLANYDTYAGEVDVGGQLIESGSIRSRVVVRVEDQQDHFQGYYRKYKPMIYAVAQADLSDATTLTLSLDSQKIDGDGLANFRALNGMYEDGSRFIVPRDLNLSPTWERADQERNSVMLTLDHAFAENWSAKLAYAHQRGEVNYRFLEMGLPQLNGNVLDVFATRNQYETERDLIDASLKGKLSLFRREHQIVLGYVYSKQESLASTYWEGNTLPPVNYLTFDPAAYPEPEWWKVQTNQFDSRQPALYASSLWRLSDNLNLQLGGRVSRYKQVETVLYQDFGYSGNGGIPHESANYDHSNIFTPFVGVVYNLNNHISVYGSYADIFQLQNDSVRDRDGKLLDPKQGENLELGVKTELSRGLVFSVAVFEIKQTHVAAQAGEFPTDSDFYRLYGPYFYAAGEGRKSSGFELELSGAITPNLQVMGGYTNQSVKFENGDRNQEQPKNIFKLSSQYHFKNTLDGLKVGGSVYWQSERETVRRTNGAHFDLPAYNLLSLWASYQLNDQWTTRLSVSNLTDKVYQSNSNTFTNYGEARRIWLTADYRF